MEETLSLDHCPTGPWEFDAAVTSCFGDMLRRSIPQYESMRRAVADVARDCIRPKGWIVDLGCSKGDALATLLPYSGKTNRFLGVDSSLSMVSAAQERFKHDSEEARIDIRQMDLRSEYPQAPACVTLSVLTLQFIPIEYRHRIVAKACRHTVSSGAFILVEKILGRSAATDAMFTTNYYRLKRHNGYSQSKIDTKRKSLEHVLCPLTAQWNETMLLEAGFQTVECFWRWMNFAGWIAIRGGHEQRGWA